MSAPTRLITAIPILPVRDMRRSVAFFEQLGFGSDAYDEGYVFVTRDDHELHLGRVDVAEWGFNPCGVYFHTSDPDALHAEFEAAGVGCLGPPRDEPWGMREFAVSDPDETLLRFGRPVVARSDRTRVDPT